MSVESNKSTALSMLIDFAATANLDPSTFTEDATWWTLSTGELPVSVHSAKTRRLADSLFDGPSHVEIRTIIAEGEVVAVETTSSQPLKDGRSYDNSHFWLVRFREGKISCVRAYFDTGAVQQAFAT